MDHLIGLYGTAYMVSSEEDKILSWINFQIWFQNVNENKRKLNPTQYWFLFYTAKNHNNFSLFSPGNYFCISRN